MIDRPPLVSLGMPAYNSGEYIAESIESLLSQTFKDFELIISNNGSTDNTRTLCEKYAEKDGRIRLFNRESNVGAIQNFEGIYPYSRGRYFAWSGSHDLWHPEWLANLVSELEDHPSVVLVYPQAVSLSPEKEVIPEEPIFFDTYKMGRIERLRKICSGSYRAGPMFYGLFRSAALSQMLPLSRVTLGDKLFAVETCLFGEIKQVRKDLWFRRHVVTRATYDEILSSQIDPRLFGNEIPFHALLPHFAHVVILFGKYCLSPKDGDYSRFLAGLFAALMYRKGKSKKINKELSRLGAALQKDPQQAENQASQTPGQEVFESFVHSLPGKNIRRLFYSSKIFRTLIMGLMIYRHDKSVRLNYQSKKIAFQDC